jgi:hypothetical protein
LEVKKEVLSHLIAYVYYIKINIINVIKSKRKISIINNFGIKKKQRIRIKPMDL